MSATQIPPHDFHEAVIAIAQLLHTVPEMAPEIWWEDICIEIERTLIATGWPRSEATRFVDTFNDAGVDEVERLRRTAGSAPGGAA